MLNLFLSRCSLAHFSAETLVQSPKIEAPFVAHSLACRAQVGGGKSAVWGEVLRSVSVRGCQLGAPGLGRMADALASASSLTVLDVGRNSVGASGIDELMAALKRLVLLERLSLDYNDLGCAGARRLGKVWSMGIHTRLSSLDMSGNALGTEGLIFLLPAFTICASLSSPSKRRPQGPHVSPFTHIGLESNGLSYSSLSALAKVLPSLRALEVLALAGNRLRMDGRRVAACGRGEAQADDARAHGASHHTHDTDFVAGIVAHCSALRYLDFATSIPAAEAQQPARQSMRASASSHASSALHECEGPRDRGAGGGLGAGRERPWWEPDFLQEACSPLTLGAALWATEVLEQWRAHHQAASDDHDAGEELEEWQREAGDEWSETQNEN